MGVALALLSALSYGVSDVIGGLAARRASPVRVALLGQLGGLVAAAVAVAVVAHGTPAPADLAWGAVSGVGTGLAMVFLFRGLSRGAMSVVVPLSAVGGVALPVLVGALVLGERPPQATWVGVVLALPALWMISRGSAGRSRASSASLVDGLVASVGIAVQYLALARAGAGAGLWPVLSGRVAAIGAVVGAAMTIMRGIGPGDGRRPPPRCSVHVAAYAAGALAAVALGAYLGAVRTEFVTVAVVLSSLYPVVPVVVGLAVLHERLRPHQAFGLAAALGAAVLMAVS